MGMYIIQNGTVAIISESGQLQLSELERRRFLRRRSRCWTMRRDPPPLSLKGLQNIRLFFSPICSL
jgi:hypothetical protein